MTILLEFTKLWLADLSEIDSLKKREVFMVKLRKEKKEKILADKRRKLFAENESQF